VSLVHSALSAATCYPALILHWRVATSWGDVALYLPPGDEWCRVAAGVTMGYLWVDLWDALKTGLFVKKLSTVVAHHVLMFYGLWVVCEYRCGEILIMYGVICELNSGFLHLRKLMSLAGYGFETPLYTVVYVLIALSFVTTRYAAHAYVAYRSWIDEPRFRLANIPPLFRYLNTAAFLFLMLFNFGLHMQIQNNTLQRDLKRFRDAKAA
jgi:TLC domain